MYPLDQLTVDLMWQQSSLRKMIPEPTMHAAHGCAGQFNKLHLMTAWPELLASVKEVGRRITPPNTFKPAAAAIRIHICNLHAQPSGQAANGNSTTRLESSASRRARLSRQRTARQAPAAETVNACQYFNWIAATSSPCRCACEAANWGRCRLNAPDGQSTTCGDALVCNPLKVFDSPINENGNAHNLML
jgi:hypothetical protein